MKKLRCKLFGCDLRYNFPSVPSKCICARCHTKYRMNTYSLEWDVIEAFDVKLGTDVELVNRWFKPR